jgi:hypothetical protein
MNGRRRSGQLASLPLARRLPVVSVERRGQPTPGDQSCGRMALLVELGDHELAGDHEGVRRSALGQATASLRTSTSSWILFSSISRRQ